MQLPEPSFLIGQLLEDRVPLSSACPQGMDDVEFLLSCVVSSGGCKTVALSVQSTAGVHEWHHFESL